jgi:hypothetical protein
MRFLIALAATAALASAAHAACTTNTPLNLYGQNGGNGLISNSGAPPNSQADFDGSVVGQIANNDGNGNYDGNGTANLTGSADCSGDIAAASAALQEQIEDSAAVAAALSAPVWLENGENFAISGGVGFTGDATAVGATGIVRIDKGLSGYAGGAFATNDTSTYAGKAGLRVGW